MLLIIVPSAVDASRVLFATPLCVATALSTIILVALAASYWSIPLTHAGLGIVESVVVGQLILVGVAPDVAVSIALLYRFTATLV